MVEGHHGETDEIDGALSLCSVCHHFSVIAVSGRLLSLRKPTTKEAHELAPYQDAALRMTRGTITPGTMMQVMREIAATVKETKH